MGAEAEPKRGRRFGIFPALLLLAEHSAPGTLSRSKYGRPPGFIRRDVAARIASQN